MEDFHPDTLWSVKLRYRFLLFLLPGISLFPLYPLRGREGIFYAVNQKKDYLPERYAQVGSYSLSELLNFFIDFGLDQIKSHDSSFASKTKLTIQVVTHRRV